MSAAAASSSHSGRSHGATEQGGASLSESPGAVRKRSRSLSKPNGKKGSREPTRQESLGGAIVRALIGTLAFLFKRPVRLFRPVKLSSWTILEAMAKREGRTFSLRYLRSVIKRESSSFLPHLLIPPLLVNTAIGFTLFEAYSLTESKLLRDRQKRLHGKGTDDIADGHVGHDDQGSGAVQHQWTPLWIVTASGAVAGAAQCFLSAPLDNVRYIIQRNVGVQASKRPTALHRRVKDISWRAVFRAAVLPFAPAMTRDRLVTDLHEATIASGNKASDAHGRKASSAETRKLWESRLKRWRGGIHGSGLVLSLIRDSVGFGSFFFIFEVSRRCAFYSSTTIDKAFAWINARGVGIVQPGTAYGGEGDTEALSDEGGDVHIEGSMRDWIKEGQQGVTDADLSYNTSRTVQGRVVAVIILLIGGAVGALSYELVGRPFELMRVVIWEGRKEWEQDMRQRRRAPSAQNRSSAARRGDRSTIQHDQGMQGGRTAVRGARVAAAHESAALGTSGRLNDLVSLRVLNTSGSRISHVVSSTSRRQPRHPLKLVNDAARRRAGVTFDRAKPRTESGSSNRASTRPHRPQQLRLTTSRSRKHTKTLEASHQGTQIGPGPRSESPISLPPLSLRPSSLSLLIEHAKKIAKVDQRYGGPDPANTPTPLLLYHTYFVAPFLPVIPHTLVDNQIMRSMANEKEPTAQPRPVPSGSAPSPPRDDRATTDASHITTAAQRTLLMSIASRRRNAFKPEEKMRHTWIRNNPVNASLAASARSSGGALVPESGPAAPGGSATRRGVLASGARRWGSGRVAWTLKRLATPYGVAFLVFAWMGGDLA